MAEYVSETTRKTLQQFGWVDGDPIPENIGDTFAQIHERIPASKSAGLYINAAALPEEYVNLIKQLLDAEKAAAVIRAQQAADPQSQIPVSPEMAALMANVKAAAQSEPIIILDDRDKAVGETPAEAPQPDEPAPVQPPPELPEVALEEKPLAEVFCPRCNWDMRHKYEVEMSEADKELFVISVLGGVRMQKNYTLMGDRYEIKFRSLLAEENKLIHRQLLLDQKRDEFQSDTEWFLRFFEYRLACSVEAVLTDGKLIAVVPELSEITAETELPVKNDDKKQPALVRLKNYVVDDVLKMEVTRRLVSNKFREFQRLYESLEAMALEPNFW